MILDWPKMFLKTWIQLLKLTIIHQLEYNLVIEYLRPHKPLKGSMVLPLWHILPVLGSRNIFGALNIEKKEANKQKKTHLKKSNSVSREGNY